jgi:hypothetical protein
MRTIEGTAKAHRVQGAETPAAGILEFAGSGTNGHAAVVALRGLEAARLIMSCHAFSKPRGQRLERMVKEESEAGRSQ